jgi:hypothetical protein
MNIFLLLMELKRLGINVCTEGDLLLVKPISLLSEAHKSAIRQHKPQLMLFFSPCKHCGSILVMRIEPTWFEVKCPSFPIHFLIEEHERSFGESLIAMAERELAA